MHTLIDDVGNDTPRESKPFCALYQKSFLDFTGKRAGFKGNTLQFPEPEVQYS
jgi:hypothetical protein